MQTTLPDLPFPSIGIRISKGPKSAAKTTAGQRPRTDLRFLKPWTSFSNDIDNAIGVSMENKGLHPGTKLTVGNVIAVQTVVSNEEKLRGHVMLDLNAAAEGVLAVLGTEGEFALPRSGYTALIGDPDFLWVENGSIQPRFLEEFKPEWVAPLLDLPRVFLKDDRFRTPAERQSIDALEQAYGYMTFNNNRYGLLSNWTRTWFLRRKETDGRKTLEYAGPIEPNGLLKAVVGLVLLSQNHWFYSSPTLSISPPHSFGDTRTGQKDQKKALCTAHNYNDSPEDGTYHCRDLDFHLCHFQLSTTRHSGIGSLVHAEFLRESGNPPLMVICKVIDIIRHGDEMLQPELQAYVALYRLQGHFIPRVYGFYNIWGILSVLALEPVGEAVSEHLKITPELRNLMKSTLGQIHSAGYIHGNVTRRNFCIKHNKVFMVDLELSRPCNNEVEKLAEKDLVDSF